MVRKAAEVWYTCLWLGQILQRLHEKALQGKSPFLEPQVESWSTWKLGWRQKDCPHSSFVPEDTQQKTLLKLLDLKSPKFQTQTRTLLQYMMQLYSPLNQLANPIQIAISPNVQTPPTSISWKVTLYHGIQEYDWIDNMKQKQTQLNGHEKNNSRWSIIELLLPSMRRRFLGQYVSSFWDFAIWIQGMLRSCSIDQLDYKKTLSLFQMISSLDIGLKLQF